MKSPSVTTPASGAIVAVATIAIVAPRMPVKMLGIASGTSTLRTISNSVMPMPRAASTVARSTWRMPTKVLVRIGGMPRTPGRW